MVYDQAKHPAWKKEVTTVIGDAPPWPAEPRRPTSWYWRKLKLNEMGKYETRNFWGGLVLWRYRRRFSRANIRWKALDEIYLRLCVQKVNERTCGKRLQIPHPSSDLASNSRFPFCSRKLQDVILRYTRVLRYQTFDRDKTRRENNCQDFAWY